MVLRQLGKLRPNTLFVALVALGIVVGPSFVALLIAYLECTAFIVVAGIEKRRSHARRKTGA